ncbi:hypothetical protein J7T55_013837 [Diaporthe amygdali]|uniref:uncharacterized protein n=1 Tax=Phomopsis amygdali TaxID=1214568 RepID=UPI0022FE898B|nr:uncharacterized protein J7T55_013837 [Diaporthe amygdali]KAJ0119634.1 hypothetical protein J7T55_013837 [Diaporthe amygdali]
MAQQQFTETSMLVDLDSLAFAGIKLPTNFAQHSADKINSSYERAVSDLPRYLLDAVCIGAYKDANPGGVPPLFPRPQMPNTAQGAEGGAKISAVLYDRIVFLGQLIQEVRLISENVHNALGGLDLNEFDLEELVGLDLEQPTDFMTPLAAYFLRSLIRLRMAHTDFQRVAQDFESVLEIIAEVYEGCIDPDKPMAHIDIVELETQLRAWESAFSEINIAWFGLWNDSNSTVLFWDQRRRLEYKKSHSG